MIKVSFQPTQRAFLKQVLVLFAIIFVSVPLAKAEDDKWIDGIKIRNGWSGGRTVFETAWTDKE